MRLTFEPDLHERNLAKLGFGTWGLGGNAYGSVSEEQASQLISYAYKNGIRIFDTSPLYGDGRSESILGGTLDNVPRETYFLITKAGLYNSGTEEMRDFSEIELSRSLKSSLSRLRTDYVDYFLLHSPTFEEISRGKTNQYGLASSINESVIRNFGVSLKSPVDYSLIEDVKSIKAIEFNYSLMDQRAGFLDGGDPKANSIFKIARTPYNFGFLTDAPPEKSPPTSPLNHLRNWSQKQFDLWHEFRLMWAEIAHSNSLKLEELALIFVLSSNLVDVVIPGFMKIDHIDAALKAAKRGPLSEESQHYLTKIYRENQLRFVISK
jgi:aryl-alcohol dehydrogenase-like predicted oxidoreductase